MVTEEPCSALVMCLMLFKSMTTSIFYKVTLHVLLYSCTLQGCRSQQGVKMPPAARAGWGQITKLSRVIYRCLYDLSGL